MANRKKQKTKKFKNIVRTEKKDYSENSKTNKLFTYRKFKNNLLSDKICIFLVDTFSRFNFVNDVLSVNVVNGQNKEVNKRIENYKIEKVILEDRLKTLSSLLTS